MGKKLAYLYPLLNKSLVKDLYQLLIFGLELVVLK